MGLHDPAWAKTPAGPWNNNDVLNDKGNNARAGTLCGILIFGFPCSSGPSMARTSNPSDNTDALHMGKRIIKIQNIELLGTRMIHRSVPRGKDGPYEQILGTVRMRSYTVERASYTANKLETGAYFQLPLQLPGIIKKNL